MLSFVKKRSNERNKMSVSEKVELFIRIPVGFLNLIERAVVLISRVAIDSSRRSYQTVWRRVKTDATFSTVEVWEKNGANFPSRSHSAQTGDTHVFTTTCLWNHRISLVIVPDSYVAEDYWLNAARWCVT